MSLLSITERDMDHAKFAPRASLISGAKRGISPMSPFSTDGGFPDEIPPPPFLILLTNLLIRCANLVRYFSRVRIDCKLIFEF